MNTFTYYFLKNMLNYRDASIISPNTEFCYCVLLSCIQEHFLSSVLGAFPCPGVVSSTLCFPFLQPLSRFGTTVIGSYLRGDETVLQRPSLVIHGQSVPAVWEGPLQMQLDHMTLGAMEVPKTTGGQVVRALQL